MSKTVYPHTVNLPAQPSITSSKKAQNEFFGWAMAVSGVHVVVGARDSDDPVQNCGSAHIYHTTAEGNHDLKQVLTAGDHAQADDSFGTAVAIDANTVVVGAYKWSAAPDLVSSGAAFVFRKQPGPDKTWRLQGKLTASDASARDEFGFSVSVSGDKILVGARSWGPTNAGAVYSFELKDGVWTETQRLTAQSEGAQFGYSVSMQGSVAAVGAPTKGTVGVHVFNFITESSEWELDTVLQASDGCDTDKFGLKVCAREGIVAVGAPGNNKCGAVYVFVPQGDKWVENKLVDDMATPAQGFGSAIDIHVPYLVAGGHHWDAQQPALKNCGSVTLFRVDEATQQWKKMCRYMNSNAKDGDYLGYAVALAKDRVLLSARNWCADDKNKRAGCVFSVPLKK